MERTMLKHAEKRTVRAPLAARPQPLWLDLNDVLGIHALQLARFGGADGIRDEDLIESAIARPLNMYLYENVNDLLALSVRLGLGIAKNHGFVDGNKRTGLASLLEFL